ncbi:hypothetical protein LTR78_006931 [Recurvomyces mirabilis]|uniref:Roadblock/LAMTOR2 domain-containing protein n=1 Tax=Recurvomyces mirabilis TaxID=574656 RepID=A0AAE0WJX7_9PEZI|nr:hypothetical protein LTR78_006931 [Recurvomyces mirabilis]KAK5153315.1 hypothetical protein LTS14_007484 [Recurvomyces mirabilis]
MQQPSPSAETEALLARLSHRPDVQSTLVLARDTGAIVRSSGLITAEDVGMESTASTDGTANGAGTGGETLTGKGTRNVDEVAKLVWTFVKSASSLVEDLNGSHDEAKLLRIRTKKNEIVVVPDAKFLAVVIHDTPPA